MLRHPPVARVQPRCRAATRRSLVSSADVLEKEQLDGSFVPQQGATAAGEDKRDGEHEQDKEAAQPYDCHPITLVRYIYTDNDMK